MVSRRAILGLLIGGGGGFAAFTQLGNDTDAPATDQESGLVADDSSSPTPTRSSTPTTTEADGSNVDTLTPRDDSSTPTEPSETASETRTPTETDTPDDTPTQTTAPTQTATATPTASRRATVSHRGTRTEIVLTNVWTDAAVLNFGGEIIPASNQDPTRLRVGLLVRNTSDDTYRQLGALARVPDPPTSAAGVDLIDPTARSVDLDVASGARARLYPELEWHPDLDRVEVVVDSGETIQQTRTETPTPTPTPTEGGFL